MIVNDLKRGIDAIRVGENDCSTERVGGASVWQFCHTGV